MKYNYRNEAGKLRDCRSMDDMIKYELPSKNYQANVKIKVEFGCWSTNAHKLPIGISIFIYSIYIYIYIYTNSYLLLYKSMYDYITWM